jgi:hypothetical protein
MRLHTRILIIVYIFALITVGLDLLVFGPY